MHALEHEGRADPGSTPRSALRRRILIFAPRNDPGREWLAWLWDGWRDNRDTSVVRKSNKS
jgi:hypothetical protein